ncbi:hypothetical protein HYDPIDRAFT_101125 [Hydnomerulius pinastri MD-312]|uniref:Phosphatidylinositol N-acetylglucosaminyltransferase subunit H conserved domain-containing protein n=1 Tax=Hydnomerulius pinastri MD-312 TaxID=994086 RepID=A0A0C9W089_9AGAM|nr:hypothetical protein HYDPIDRAFT_101125 [Hydnomerulius pinastri MD-312]
MRQTRPLLDLHPEFSVIEWPGFSEYRVENWRLARNGSGKIIRGATTWSWLDPCVPVIFSLAWSKVSSGSLVAYLLIGITLVLFVWSRCNQVLHESVLVFPTLGIQLESHRGHPSLEPLFVSRRFIHASSLEDFVIHEGLRRWDVRYYLAAIKRSSNGGLSIQVAFENILPYFPVLQEVYIGVQNAMFPGPNLQDS